MSGLLPKLFCWTRFGTEAGERIDHILKRKEYERKANGGIFLWGIGNAIGPSILALITRQIEPQVVFSPIRSKARPVDTNPELVVAWQRGWGIDGSRFEIPKHSLVTSRFNPGGRKRAHYALVCSSTQPILPLRSDEKVVFNQLRNLRTGKPVGASQVTAVVEQVKETTQSSLVYDAALRAALVYPYLVELREAMPVISC